MARTYTRRMHRLREEFFRTGQAARCCGSARCELLAVQSRDRLCRSGRLNAGSHNIDYCHPVATHPELQEDPSNFRHPHTLCNGQRGKNAPSPGLGEAVPDWW